MPAEQRILIVEDDRTIARGLRELFKAEGYAVSVTSYGKSGLSRILSSRPDLVILDLRLPGLTGFEVLRQARSAGYQKPVIILSAQKEQVDKLLGLEVGADDFVTKPFDPAELSARVRAQLRAASQREKGKREGGTVKSRRLLSLMFTDMVGFSAKMNKDERRALKLLKKHNTHVGRAISQEGGRIVEIIGDAFFASFESALQAARCGLAIQRDLRRYGRDAKPGERIQVRIGIHVGDVIETEGKLRGDTVNIAARLQELGGVGSLAVSEAFFEAVKGKLRFKGIKLGKRKLKNIRRPVTVYRITM
ncbi:MAG: response regulator [Bacteroidota bacterium]